MPTDNLDIFREKLSQPLLDEPLPAHSVNPRFLAQNMNGDRFFGMEIEVGEAFLNQNVLAKALKLAGVTSTSRVSCYHAGNTYQQWRSEQDSSVLTEIVSPRLSDSQESWSQVAKVCETVSMFGAQVSTRAGNHIHVTVKEEEKPCLFFLGWLFSELLEEVSALPDGSRRSGEYAERITGEALFYFLLSRGRSRSRYQALNFPHRLPTVEFRQPESSFNVEHLKANVLLVSLLVEFAQEAPMGWEELEGLANTFEGRAELKREFSDIRKQVRILARTTGEEQFLLKSARLI